MARALESFLELFNSALDGHTLGLLKIEGGHISPFLAHSLSPHFNLKARIEGLPQAIISQLQQGKPVFLTSGHEALMRFTRLYGLPPLIKSALISPINAKEPLWVLYLDSLKAYDIHKTKEKLLIQAARFLPKLLHPADTPPQPSPKAAFADFGVWAELQKRFDAASNEAALLAAFKFGLDTILSQALGFILVFPSKALVEITPRVFTLGGLRPFSSESIDWETSLAQIAIAKDQPAYVDLSKTQEPVLAEDIPTPKEGYAFLCPLTSALETKGLFGVFTPSAILAKERLFIASLGREFLRRLFELQLEQTFHFKDPYTKLLNALAFEAFIAFLVQKNCPFGVLSLKLKGLKGLTKVYGYHRTLAFTRTFFQTLQRFQSREIAIFSLGLEDLFFVSRRGKAHLDRLLNTTLVGLLDSLETVLEKRLDFHLVWQCRLLECPKDASSSMTLFKIMYDEKEYR